MKIILLSFLIFFTPIAAQAAGFALIEQSASGMGNAFAGGGAAAEDASTIFFNPAGMTYIQGTQVVGAVHLIKPSAEFSGQLTPNGRPVGGNGGNAGDLAFVPNMYFKMDLNESVKLGFGVNAPFGLKTEYDPTWLGRFHAIKSEVKTVNFNPAVAFKVNDQLSVGGGLSAMWAQATLSRAFYLGALPAPETTVNITGTDWGFGYNLGAIYQATADTRMSVAYRSKVNQTLEGTSRSPLAAPLNTNVTAKVALPDTFSMSAFSRLSDQFDLMGDVTWTHWSRFKELRIDFANAVPDAVTPENWSNTLRYSVGANYHYSDVLKIRAGLAYDEEAISDQLLRTARIPGNDRKWVSLGANYKVSPNSSVDVGYAHLFINNASIDKNEGAANGTLTGNYKGSVNILSAQFNYNF